MKITKETFQKAGFRLGTYPEWLDMTITADYRLNSWVDPKTQKTILLGIMECISGVYHPQPGTEKTMEEMKNKYPQDYDIWKHHSNELKQHFWKKQVFWSDGYFVCSTGDVSTQTILEYIKSQG